MKCPNCKIELLGSMKRCPKCGYDIEKGKIDDEYLAKRNERFEEEKAEKARIEEEERKEKEEQELRLQRFKELFNQMPGLRASFLSTTGFDFEGYKITEYIGIKSGESVIGTGLLSDLSAGITDFLGVESFAVGSKLGQAKERALKNLIDNCIVAGANAAIGVDLDIMTYGPNMMVACANGTAVKIEKL